LISYGGILKRIIVNLSPEISGLFLYMKTSKKIIFLGIILLLPAIIYLILFNAEHIYKPLPYLGKKEVVDGDTVYHPIADYTFNTIVEQTASIHKSNGKVRLLYFFNPYLDKNEVKITSHIREKIQRSLIQSNKGNETIVDDHFAIIGNWVTDSLPFNEQYYDYIDKIGKESFWYFVFLTQEESKNLLASDLCFPPCQSTEKGFTNYVFLIDREAKLRGVFDGTSVEQSKKLLDAISALIKEEYVPLKENS